jgi:glutamate/tyrosine decarboxylase-like PLP-dependent enzyme
MLEKGSIELLRKAIDKLEEGFLELPEFHQPQDAAGEEAVMMEVAERMHDNLPYFHPLYAGQFMIPPHPLAKAAYMLALWINPNNHALDGGRASSQMEKEAVAQMAAMYGWKDHLGHLTSGGTVANMEALYVGGQQRPGKKVLASDQAHYTHSRLSNVLGLRFQSVPSDGDGRMSVEALEGFLRHGGVGTVVATVGTTGVGAVDPIPELLELRDRYDFHLHADAAYGGYFILASNLDEGTRRSYRRLAEVDSLVVDPHKRGLQPYGCGCILFRDPSVGRYYKHDSPYTYFTSDDLHLGEISMECSRPGAAAVALWATLRLLPLVEGGEFARGLESGRTAALRIHGMLASDEEVRCLMRPELDILVFAPRAERASEISRLSDDVFLKAAGKDLHLAKLRLPAKMLRAHWPEVIFDQEAVTCLRSSLLKKEHLEWSDEIVRRLRLAASEARKA